MSHRTHPSLIYLRMMIQAPQLDLTLYPFPALIKVPLRETVKD